MPALFATPDRAPTAAVGRSRAPHAVRVLLADDSEVVRQHLSALLDGVREVDIVGEAADVDDALEAVRRLRPDAVVLDIQMPGGSGIDVLRQIKAEFPDTTVLMLSNHADDFYRRTCRAEGASYFFDKSMEFELVGSTLRRLGRNG